MTIHTVHFKPPVWSRNPAKHSDGSLLQIIGGNGHIINVASTHRAIGSKSEPDAPLWYVKMHLPGIALKKDANDYTPRFKTEDEAKDKAERLVFTWFDWIGA